jgi:hypothetical protein
LLRRALKRRRGVARARQPLRSPTRWQLWCVQLRSVLALLLRLWLLRCLLLLHPTLQHLLLPLLPMLQPLALRWQQLLWRLLRGCC